MAGSRGNQGWGGWRRSERRAPSPASAASPPPHNGRSRRRDPWPGGRRQRKRAGLRPATLPCRELLGRGLGRSAPPPPAQPRPRWASGSRVPGSPAPDLAVRPRPSPAPSSPPPPERPEPGRASNYPGLRSTKDWAGRWGCCGPPGVVSGRRCVPRRAAPFVSGRVPSPSLAAPCFLSRHSFLRPLKSWTSQNGPTLFFSPLS